MTVTDDRDAEPDSGTAVPTDAAGPDLPLDGHEPYADVDVTALPGWWRRAVEHFREQGIGPYRPPRFTDGTLGPALVDALEADLGVDIRFRCKNASVGADWTVLVDGEPVGTIGRHRSRDRYTVFEMTGEAFADWVRSAVDGDGSTG